jgi:uncharacterized repeat protein (TIGR03806 family)
MRCVWGLVSLLVLSGCDDDVGGGSGDAGIADLGMVDLTAPFMMAQYGLASRPSNTTCIAPTRPVDATTVILAKPFPNVKGSLPIAMRQPPGDPSRWFLVNKGGTVVTFPNMATATTSPFIDITTEVNATQAESGLLGMAFHPQFATNKQFFLSYSAHSTTSPVDLRNTISRFTLKADGTGDPASEQKVLPPTDGTPAKLGGNPAGAAANPLDKAFVNHNGGNILFGPDGFLYFGMGDGGSAGDPYGNGQNVNDFFGKMLRVDVDNVPAGQRYGIPASNPFAAGGGAPEIFAWGLRNPWRWSFDRATGDLWVGDVGQNLYEEIDKVALGGDYGWNKCEGFHTYPGNVTPCPGYIEPLEEYAHVGGASEAVVGGYVYHGTAIPSLVGCYLYADEVDGRLVSFCFDAAMGKMVSTKLLSTGFNPSSFAEGEDGELYLLSYGDGAIWKIVPNGNPMPSTFPQKLSQTGCVDPSDPTKPAAGMIPYNLNTPLWSDGADKDRWMALPDNTQIHVETDGDWTFPNGTVLMKQFSVGGKRVETRLLMHHPDGIWAGYSYEWLDDGSDAVLLQSGKTKPVSPTQNWTYPSRSDCLECHTTAAGRSLGPETAQMNRSELYPQAPVNLLAPQLDTLQHIGMFDAPLAANPPALAAPDDTTQTVETRARDYLHANCSFCHRPNSTGQGPSDWRWQTPFKMTNTCNQMPQEGTLGITGAMLIVPGNTAKSLVSVRMHALDANRMPPLATHVVDATGTGLVDQWIQSLTACP